MLRVSLSRRPGVKEADCPGFRRPSPVEGDARPGVSRSVRFHSLSRHLLSSSCVPGTVLGAGDTAVNQMSQKSPSFC